MAKKFYITTAIDYPNSRPHIGTAFEKVGADVQARYRRMEGHAVTFLMGNDENTLKVADKAKELGEEPRAYCDRMAGEFRAVWDALDVSYDVFVQPDSRRNEMIGFIEAEGLDDLNISRQGETWGIPIPFDPEFTIYVWFDALLTYITGIGYGDDEARFNQLWPCDTHFIGKDIT